MFKLLALIWMFSSGVSASSLEKSEWLEGRNLSVAKTVSSKGVSIIQFWASWCSGCGENMKKLIEITKSFGPGLGFFPFTIDETKAEAKQYFKVKGEAYAAALPLSVFDRDMAFTQSIGVSSVPYLVVLNSKGKVVYRFGGHIKDEQKKEIANVIRGLGMVPSSTK